MATAIRTIGHEDRLSLVDHLTELRTRLIIAALALAVAFGVCFWQNHALLRIVNRPLAHETQRAVAKGHGPLGQVAVVQQALLRIDTDIQRQLDALSRPASGVAPATRAELARLRADVAAATARVPRVPTGNQPVTLGIGEPFTATVTISFYFALLLAAPVILFELYGFVLPAFSPAERRVALPAMLAVPILFSLGVAFGYLVVLPAAVRFFQNFNSGSFNVFVQARDYYRFAALTLLAMGGIFQVPVGVLAVVQAGVVTTSQLRGGRRYAVVAAAAVAALLPGDVLTMGLEMAPLVVLYELSILVAAFVERRSDARRPDSRPRAAAPEPPPRPEDSNDAV